MIKNNESNTEWLRRWNLEIAHLPLEMRSNLLWAVSSMAILDAKTGRVDKSPRNPHTGKRLSVTDSEGWVTFDEALNSGYPARGFLLRNEDPYVVIDLDKSDDNDAKNRARKIYDSFDSYAEKSYSGNGVHIILTGPNEAGRRKGNVEIYSQDRYIICTGKVLKDLPITDGGESLHNLRKTLAETDNPDALPQIEDVIESESDTQILKKMFEAKNGDSVRSLYETKPSSTDDWSLLDSQLAQHICFYTKNRNQALRLFSSSALYRGYESESKKAGYENPAKYEEDYLIRRTFARAWSLALAREQERARKESAADAIIANAKAVSAAMGNLNTEGLEKLQPTATGVKAPPRGTDDIEKMIIDPDTGEVITQLIKPHKSKLRELKRPTGLLGEITDFIMQAAPRPVLEVAIAGAITFLSGLTGRHYNIAGTGLGLYTILLAGTGRGKEAATTGIGCLTDAIMRQAPVISDFRGPSQIASGQALIRTMADEHSIPSKFMFLSEFSHMLQVISSRDATGADMKTRQVLLDMFSKSGWGSTIQESAYADKSNNTKVVYNPNLALMGDTTSEMLFENMSAKLISEGFLPRFLYVEYDGPRTAVNLTLSRIPSEDLVTRCVTLVHQIMSLKQSNQCMNITISSEAQLVLNNFSDLADYRIEQLSGQPMAEMWNRAHLMVLRLAGIVAVGNNMFEPTVTLEDVQWAQTAILRSLDSVALRAADGKLSDSEAGIRTFVRNLAKQFFKENIGRKLAKKNRGRWEVYHGQGVVPYKYFSEQTEKESMFVSRSEKHSSLVQKALTDLVDQGDLILFDIRMLNEPDKRIKSMEKSYLPGPMLFDTSVYNANEYYNDEEEMPNE